jgi:hypothetical protein
MTKDADVSLESDDLAGDLAKEAAPPPVVVVQYKKRGIPSWIAFPFFLAVPLLSILFYHRMVVEPYRVRAAEAERVLDALTKAPPPAAPASRPSIEAGGAAPVAPGPSVPVVPINAQAVAEVKAVAPVAAPLAPPSFTLPVPSSSPLPGPNASSSSLALSSADPAGSPSRLPAGAAAGAPASITGEPVAQALKPETGAPVTGGADSPPPLPGPASAAGDQKVSPPPGEASPKQQAATPALAIIERRLDAAFPAPGSSPIDVTQAHSAEAAAPPRTGGVHTRGLGPLADQGGERSTENERTKSADGSRQDGRRGQIVPALEPLPTREESLRAIADEAAKKQAEILESRINRQVESRSLRYEERVKFRQELREILRVHGNDAGDEIDRLSRRFGYEATSEVYARADRIWRFGKGMTQLEKVKMIRSLDLPESVILDFLSDNQAVKLKTRGGPRNQKEVRIRAARQYLALELPPLSESPVLVPSGGPMSNVPRPKASAAPVARDGPPRS